jgi:hypothetical protein
MRFKSTSKHQRLRFVSLSLQQVTRKRRKEQLNRLSQSYSGPDFDLQLIIHMIRYPHLNQMESPGQLDEICRWPRRLLHVPSMTSHKWMPGNIYGGHASPDYNAISYTWGRWQLRSGQCQDAKSLDVAGTAWPLPRIAPEHFSVVDFTRVIKKAAIMDPNHPLEFVWLDVACIDQRESSLEMAVEVGRQAKIFKGAHQVFIWLTKYNIGQLCDWGVQLEKCSAESECISEMVRLINLIRLDPWFTSPWTLQEAFLRQDAIFLSRESEPIVEDGRSTGAVRLKDLINFLEYYIRR